MSEKLKFAATVLLGMLAIMAATLSMGGCGFNGLFGEKWGVRVVGAGATVNDDTRDQKAAETKANKTFRVKITPIQPTPTAIVDAPATRPAHPWPVPIEPILVAIGDKTVTAPAGSAVEIEAANETEAVPSVFQHNRSANAQGASLYQQTGERGNFDSSAPSVSLAGRDGGKADGGDTGTSWTNFASGLSGLTKTLGGVAVVLLLAALGWFIVTKDVKTALTIAAGGVLLLTAAVVVDKYPWVLLLLGLAGIAAGVLWYLAHRREKALATVVNAVEQSPDGGAAVKANVSTIDDGTAKGLITAIKAKLQRLRPVVPQGVAQAAKPPAPAVISTGVTSPKTEVGT